MAAQILRLTHPRRRSRADAGSPRRGQPTRRLAAARRAATTWRLQRGPRDLEAALPGDYYERQALPWEAAFLAGRSLVEYRRRGGQRRSPMPDFYIGAHAVIAGLTLLTRDSGRYRTYFPQLRVIAP